MPANANRSQVPVRHTANDSNKEQAQQDRPLAGDSLCEIDSDGNISNHAMHATAMSEAMDDACTAYARKILGDKADSYGSLFSKD